MENVLANQTLFEDFLIQLEYLALSAEDKIATLESTNSDYKYIRDLLEVLKKSKLAFVEGYYSLTKDKEQEFEKLITRIMTYKEVLIEVQKASRNLYYLSENDLYHKKEAESQRKTAEEVLERFTKRLIEFISKIDYPKNKKEIKHLKTYVEDIITLANDFEEFGVVKDIDFFQQIIEEVDLTANEKKELIYVALINNLEMYQKEEEKEEIEDYEVEPSKEMEKEREEDKISKEQIEELLEEMLSENTSDDDQEKRKHK